MFKKFFTNFMGIINNLREKIKNSKIYKMISGVLNKVSKASLVVSAFNIGCVKEVLSNMGEATATVGESIMWSAAVCKEYLKDIKIHNFHNGILTFMIPFVLSVGFVAINGGKLMYNAINYIMKSHKAYNSSMSTNETPEVINVFA